MSTVIFIAILAILSHNLYSIESVPVKDRFKHITKDVNLTVSFSAVSYEYIYIFIDVAHCVSVTRILMLMQITVLGLRLKAYGNCTRD